MASISVAWAAPWPRSTPASQARWRSVQARPSSKRMPWRSSSLESRCRQRIRSTRTASRARTRSRSASSSAPGTLTGCSLPASSSRTGARRRGGRPSPAPPRRAGSCSAPPPRTHTTALELTREPIAGRPGLIGGAHRPRQPAAQRRRLIDLAGHPEPLHLARLGIEHRQGWTRLHPLADLGIGGVELAHVPTDRLRKKAAQACCPVFGPRRCRCLIGRHVRRRLTRFWLRRTPNAREPLETAGRRH
jgi:hypothetical protein